MCNALNVSYQDDLLYVFWWTPVKHSCRIIFLYVLIHCFHLIVSRDQQRVVPEINKPQKHGQTWAAKFMFHFQQQRDRWLYKPDVCREWIGCWEAGLLLQDVIESRSSGSQGRLIGPLEGWRFQHSVRERLYPSAAAAVMTLFSIIRPLELQRLSSLPPALCPSNLMHRMTAKPHGQHRTAPRQTPAVRYTLLYHITSLTHLAIKGLISKNLSRARLMSHISP